MDPDDDGDDDDDDDDYDHIEEQASLNMLDAIEGSVSPPIPL